MIDTALYIIAFAVSLMAFLKMQWVLKHSDGNAIRMLKGYANFTLVLVLIMGAEILLNFMGKSSTNISSLFGVIIVLSLYMIIARNTDKFASEHGFEISKFAVFEYFDVECPKKIMFDKFILFIYAIVYIVLFATQISNLTILSSELKYMYIANSVSSFMLFAIGISLLAFKYRSAKTSSKLFGGEVATLSLVLLATNNITVDAVINGIKVDSAVVHYMILISLVIIYMLVQGIREKGGVEHE